MASYNARLTELPLRVDARSYTPHTRVVGDWRWDPGDRDSNIRERLEGVIVGRTPDQKALVQIDQPRDPRDWIVQIRYRDLFAPAGTSPPRQRTAEETRRLLFEGVPRVDLDARTIAAIKRAENRPVKGTKSDAHPEGIPAGTYFTSIRESPGSHVFAIPGTPRDMEGALARNPDISDAALDMCAADFDVVTNAPPMWVELCAMKIGEDLPYGGLWTQRPEFGEPTKKYGIVGVGEHKVGLDIAPLKASYTIFPPAQLGLSLTADAFSRDFTMNAFYVDVATGQGFDPTGRGLADARDGRLWPANPDIYSNPTLAFRYLKFLLKKDPESGKWLYWAPREAREMIRDHVAKIWRGLARQEDKKKGLRAPGILANVRRVLPAGSADLPAEPTGAQLAQAEKRIRYEIRRLQKMADGEGLEQPWRRYVAPHMELLVDQLLHPLGT